MDHTTTENGTIMKHKEKEFSYSKAIFSKEYLKKIRLFMEDTLPMIEIKLMKENLKIINMMEKGS